MDDALAVLLDLDRAVLAHADDFAISRQFSLEVPQQIERHAQPLTPLDLGKDVAHHDAIRHALAVRAFEVQFTDAPQVALAQVDVAEVVSGR